MYKNTFLTKHINKNISNYIISNYIFKSKKIDTNLNVKSYFFNPLYILTTKLYLYKQTFLILKLSMFLKKENLFFIFFYLNFFQIPLLLNNNNSK
jgi:hypothetical protein